MDAVTEIEQALGADWLPTVYREKVRTQRTRACELDIAAGENKVSILHTLLGIELKVGRKRFSCPDLATARYMQVFARCGCGSFAVPYDITKISTLADELELGWQKALLLCDETASRRGEGASKIRKALIRKIRKETAEIGAGPAMPEFNQSTKQRSQS